MLFKKLGKGGYLFNHDRSITPGRIKRLKCLGGWRLCIDLCLTSNMMKRYDFQEERVSFFHREVSGTGTRENSFLRFLSRVNGMNKTLGSTNRGLCQDDYRNCFLEGTALLPLASENPQARLRVSPRGAVGEGRLEPGRLGVRPDAAARCLRDPLLLPV